MWKHFFTEAVSLENLVFLAGCLHFLQIPALMFAPNMLNWKEDLAKLTIINRRIFQMIGLGIMLTTIGAGVVVVLAPAEIAGGSRLGTALCGYLSLVWAQRALIQVFLYAKVWPQGLWGRLSHYGLFANVLLKTGIYFMVFLIGVLRWFLNV